MRRTKLVGILSLVVVSFFLANPAAAHPEHFVAPDGDPSGDGSKAQPWDLASALSGSRNVQPGAVLWVRGGAYRGKFEVKLAGRDNSPIHVRVWPGERATIMDSGLNVVEPADYVWIWDLEIAGSTPIEKRRTNLTGSHPEDLPGTGGINVYAGRGCKFINLVIHDNVQGGVGWWVGSTNSEFHGCLIYNNGWDAPDRGHGHCMYIQNRDGVKTISNCIMSVPPWGGSYTMHAYGSSRAYVDNFVIRENIAFEKGPFLVGGGRPSRNITVVRNCLHGVDMRIGYSAPENEDCEVRDNIIVDGQLSILRYKKAVQEGNLRQLPAAKAILIPNQYDANRAHVAVYNTPRRDTVPLDVGSFLKPGESFRLMRAKDFYGDPELAGTVRRSTINIPMQHEFAAFVLLKHSN